MSQQPTQQDLEATDREIESTRTGHEQDRDRGQPHSREDRASERSRGAHDTSDERRRDADAGGDYREQGGSNAREE